MYRLFIVPSVFLQASQATLPTSTSHMGLSMKYSHIFPGVLTRTKAY